MECVGGCVQTVPRVHRAAATNVADGSAGASALSAVRSHQERHQ